MKNVKDILKSKKVGILTIAPDAMVLAAIELMAEKNVGSLLVMEGDKLVGIITAIDLLSAFINMMGLLRDSSRLDVLVGKVGGVEDVTRIIKAHGCEIISVATESHSSRRKLYCFRLEKGELDKAIDALEDAGHKVVSVVD